MVYILVFLTVELCLVLDASGQCAKGNGDELLGDRLRTGAGVFGFLAGLLGYYATAHYLCEDALPFNIPMGRTARFFVRKNVKNM